MLSVDTGFKMKMFGSGTSCASGQGNGLAGFDGIAALYQILEVMAVYGFQSEGMADDYYIAVGTIGLGHSDDTIEGAADGVFGASLDIDACVASVSTSVSGDHFASRKGERIFGLRQTVQMDLQLFLILEQSRSGYPYMVDFHRGERGILCLQDCGKDEEQKGYDYRLHRLWLFKILYRSAGGGSILH